MTPDGLPADFRLNGEAFDPVRFFSGKFMAQGMFVDRFGSVQRRFAAEINCRTNDNQTELHEAFIYDDGETGTAGMDHHQKRRWYLYCQYR
ncbi:MAG: DUF3833 family protein [Candidatus Puniceispirillaceae bacterium]